MEKSNLIMIVLRCWILCSIFYRILQPYLTIKGTKNHRNNSDLYHQI